MILFWGFYEIAHLLGDFFVFLKGLKSGCEVRLFLKKLCLQLFSCSCQASVCCNRTWRYCCRCAAQVYLHESRYRTYTEYIFLTWWSSSYSYLLWVFLFPWPSEMLHPDQQQSRLQPLQLLSLTQESEAGGSPAWGWNFQQHIESSLGDVQPKNVEIALLEWWNWSNMKFENKREKWMTYFMFMNKHTCCYSTFCTWSLKIFISSFSCSVTVWESLLDIRHCPSFSFFSRREIWSSRNLTIILLEWMNLSFWVRASSSWATFCSNV